MAISEALLKFSPFKDIAVLIEKMATGQPLDSKEVFDTLPTPEEEAKMSQFFIFSPFISPVGETELEMLLVLLGVVKLAKTPEGLKVLRDVAVQYLKTVGHVLGELEASSASNWLVAMINQRTAVKVYRRMGLISASEAKELDATYSWMFTTTIVKEGITESLAGLGSLAKGVTGIIHPAK